MRVFQEGKINMNNLIRKNFGSYPICGDLFDEIISEVFHNDMVGMKTTYPMNIVQMKEGENIIGYRLEYALAGFTKEEIKVTLSKENYLVVRCEKQEKQDKENETVVKSGISYRSFENSYKLPSNIDRSGIKIKFENGLLKIDIPFQNKEDTEDLIEIE